MQREVKAKLEEIIELLNDPDEVVLDKEVKEKLEKIIEHLGHPEEVTAEREAFQKKMKEIKELVSDAMIDLEVDVSYFIPGTEGYNANSTPHILLIYAEDEYTTRTRKVSLGNTAMQSSPEDFTKHVILAIEEFKDEIDDIKMG
ncbi:MAG: hypothetical protein COB07_03050 [Sulfurovum sp.]|nr:MAG: hypothetical protein COB07_03050 [Sulfurovum sp.]